MKIKLWPFFYIEVRRYATRYQIADAYHKLFNTIAVKRKRHFKDAHLCYSATSRCDCGEGLAYPKGITGMHGKWDCAGVLTGRVPVSQATEKNAKGEFVHKQFPFTFYEIKSENQPSAYGATTRPKAED